MARRRYSDNELEAELTKLEKNLEFINKFVVLAKEVLKDNLTPEDLNPNETKMIERIFTAYLDEVDRTGNPRFIVQMEEILDLIYDEKYLNDSDFEVLESDFKKLINLANRYSKELYQYFQEIESRYRRNDSYRSRRSSRSGYMSSGELISRRSESSRQRSTGLNGVAPAIAPAMVRDEPRGQDTLFRLEKEERKKGDTMVKEMKAEFEAQKKEIIAELSKISEELNLRKEELDKREEELMAKEERLIEEEENYKRNVDKLLEESKAQQAQEAKQAQQTSKANDKMLKNILSAAETIQTEQKCQAESLEKILKHLEKIEKMEESHAPSRREANKPNRNLLTELGEDMLTTDDLDKTKYEELKEYASKKPILTLPLLYDSEYQEHVEDKEYRGIAYTVVKDTAPQVEEKDFLEIKDFSLNKTLSVQDLVREFAKQKDAPAEYMGIFKSSSPIITGHYMSSSIEQKTTTSVNGITVNDIQNSSILGRHYQSTLTALGYLSAVYFNSDISLDSKKSKFANTKLTKKSHYKISNTLAYELIEEHKNIAQEKVKEIRDEILKSQELLYKCEEGEQKELFVGERLISAMPYSESFEEDLFEDHVPGTIRAMTKDSFPYIYHTLEQIFREHRVPVLPIYSTTGLKLYTFCFDNNFYILYV